MFLLDKIKKLFNVDKQQKLWDNKDDHCVIKAYNDALDWLSVQQKSDIIDHIQKQCVERLDLYIIPQMKKRGLLSDYQRSAKDYREYINQIKMVK